MEKRQNQGFTIIELMVTLAVVGVLLAVAVPGLSDLLERNRLQSASTNLYTALLSARSEALKRNQDIVVACKQSDGSACATAGSGGIWKYGWLVFPADDASEILREEGELRAGDTLFAVDDPNSPGTKYNSVSFRPSGTASTELSFVLCNADADPSTARVVSVEVTGRPTRHVSAGQCNF